jgi:hypothetical protein
MSWNWVWSLAVAPLLVTAGCGAYWMSNNDPAEEMQTLGFRIQQLQGDTHSARTELQLAMESLEELLTHSKSRQEPASFAAFRVAVQRSHDKAVRLDQNSRWLKHSAQPLLKRWRQSLAGIEDFAMRRRVQMQLDQICSNYASMERTLEMAQAGLARFNHCLRRHESLLTSSAYHNAIALNPDDVQELSNLAHDVDRWIVSCQTATSHYVDSIVLPLQHAAVASPPR